MVHKGGDQPVPSPRARTPLPGRRTLLASALAAVGGFVLGWLVPRQRGAEPPAGTADLGAADLGAFYHQWSKPGHGPEFGAAPDWGRQPPRTKTYPDVPRIPLPDPSGWRALSLEQTIAARRSVRDYTGEPLTLDDLSRLLHAAQGLTEPRRSFRAAPSAGALYPIELYPLVRDVAGLEAGHLPLRRPGTRARTGAGGRLAHRRDAGRAGPIRAGPGRRLLRSLRHLPVHAHRVYPPAKYRERTYRYVLLEAGHVGQNLCLAATGLGLGACTVGAFDDDDLNELLGLDGQEEAALYIIAVGNRTS